MNDCMGLPAAGQNAAGARSAGGAGGSGDGGGGGESSPSPLSTDQLFFEERVHRVFDRLERTLISKHKDYGPTNVSESPGGPLMGVRVRIHDKISRINNLLDSGKQPKHEALEDSFLDLANYCVIAILLLRRQWPGAK